MRSLDSVPDVAWKTTLFRKSLNESHPHLNGSMKILIFAWLGSGRQVLCSCLGKGRGGIFSDTY